MKVTIFAENYSLLLSNPHDMDNRILLENFVFWEKKPSYLLSIEKFLNEQIDGDTFVTEVIKLWYINLRTKQSYTSKEWLEKLECIQFEKLKGFSKLMSKLFEECDIFDPDPYWSDWKSGIEIPEEELREHAKATLFVMKNYYP